MAEKSELYEIDGCGEASVTKLEENGIGTLMTLAVSSPTEISTITGMSENKARKMIKGAREKLSLGFEKAKDFAHKRDIIQKISVGCEVWDEALEGGFESGMITEIYGRFGSGKSQMAHQMVVRALLENDTNKAIYIDSENTFRPERIKDICEAQELDYDEAMERIFVARAMNADHQILLIDEVEKLVQADNNYRLLVIDSLTSHFRSEFIGRGTLAGRQQLLNKHMHKILKIADIYNLVVICTNQVMSDPAQMYGNPEKPIGGNIVGHNSTTRIYVRPAAKGTWAFKIVDSPNIGQLEGSYTITKDGIVDV